MDRQVILDEAEYRYHRDSEFHGCVEHGVREALAEIIAPNKDQLEMVAKAARIGGMIALIMNEKHGIEGKRNRVNELMRSRKPTNIVEPEEVTAALEVLREHFDMGGNAKVSDYVWEGQKGEERKQAIRELQAADEKAELEVRIVVADAIRAARQAQVDE